ncbi:High-affinity proline transporter PutP [Shewanella oneidensis]|nr:High-affinity proline transporter PutP [Shewanella oneidensis]
MSWTDFFQASLMLIALLIIPFAVFSRPESHAGIESIDPAMLALISDKTTMIGLLSLLAWGLGYFGQPHILSRFMAIGTVDALPTSRRIAMSWMILSLLGALATGLAGSVYFANEPLANAETVFFHLAQAAFNPWIGGLLIAAILSAIMSTIDSQLLVCSSVITEDFYRKWLRPTDDRELMMVGRMGVLAIAVIAGIIALNPENSVLNLVSYAWQDLAPLSGQSYFYRCFGSNIAAMVLSQALLLVP